MSTSDALSEQISILRIRKKAASRNEIFFAALSIVALLVTVVYFRLTYQIEWLVLVFPLVTAVAAALSLLQVSKQSELSSIIELIETLRRSDYSS
jgi:hypothetical protein